MPQKMTPKEYKKYAEKKAPRSKIFANILKAFLTGGLICTVGQLVMNLLKNAGEDKVWVSNMTTIIMIFLGALLTGLNIYDDIGRFGGAGSSIPVTGFANSIVSPAMEYKKEGYVMGVGAKMFLIAGPVLVYGICSSIAVGLIYYFLSE